MSVGFVSRFTKDLDVFWFICLLWLVQPTLAKAGSESSIQNPGPDMANFPNSAFTLPKQRAYVEIASTYNSKQSNPEQYTLGYLLRYGLTDDLELRLISIGLTIANAEDKNIVGMSPQIFDIKYHLLSASNDSLLPAIGIEAQVQTTWGSPAFKGGTQGAFSLNFDHALPYDLALEYNVGFIGQQLDSGASQYQLALEWALQKNLTEDLAIFVNGFTNTGVGLTTSSMGVGGQWTINQRFAIYVNCSAGLTSTTPPLFGLMGFALAF